jgi:hypothetical protein
MVGSTDLKDIESRVLSLPIDARASLAHRLLRSVGCKSADIGVNWTI